jgi:hypothetical protein
VRRRGGRWGGSLFTVEPIWGFDQFDLNGNGPGAAHITPESYAVTRLQDTPIADIRDVKVILLTGRGLDEETETTRPKAQNYTFSSLVHNNIPSEFWGVFLYP